MTLVIDTVTLMIFKSTVNDVSVTYDTITDYAIKAFSKVHCSLSSLWVQSTFYTEKYILLYALKKNLLNFNKYLY